MDRQDVKVYQGCQERKVQVLRESEAHLAFLGDRVKRENLED